MYEQSQWLTCRGDPSHAYELKVFREIDRIRGNHEYASPFVLHDEPIGAQIHPRDDPFDFYRAGLPGLVRAKGANFRRSSDRPGRSLAPGACGERRARHREEEAVRKPARIEPGGSTPGYAREFERHGQSRTR